MIITRDPLESCGPSDTEKKKLDLTGKDGTAPLPSCRGCSANSSLGSLVAILNRHSAEQFRHTHVSAMSFPTRMTSWKTLLFPKANSVFDTLGCLHLCHRLSPTLWFIYAFLLFACACVYGDQKSMSDVPLFLSTSFLRQGLSLNKGLGISSRLAVHQVLRICRSPRVTVVCHCLAADLVLSFRTHNLVLVQPTEPSP